MTWTADETELRARSVRFFKPPRAPHLVALPGLENLIGSDADVYLIRLAEDGAASPAVRYRRLESDIAADRALLTPFRIIACRVAATDSGRRFAVSRAGEGEPLSAGEGDEIVRRMSDNRALIDETERRIAARYALYQISLDRLALASPDPQSAEALYELEQLHRALSAPDPC